MSAALTRFAAAALRSWATHSLARLAAGLRLSRTTRAARLPVRSHFAPRASRVLRGVGVGRPPAAPRRLSCPLALSSSQLTLINIATRQLLPKKSSGARSALASSACGSAGRCPCSGGSSWTSSLLMRGSLLKSMVAIIGTANALMRAGTRNFGGRGIACSAFRRSSSRRTCRRRCSSSQRLLQQAGGRRLCEPATSRVSCHYQR